MKKQIGIILLLLFTTFYSSYSQTVQVCISIDGTPMPVSKTAMLCRKDTATLSMTNCASTPETNISYIWRNLSIPPNTDSLTSTIMAKDTGRWVGYIINNNTLIQYTDTIHLRHPPIIDVVSMSPSLGPFCPPDPVNVTLTTTGPVATYQWYDKTAGPLVLIPGATNSTFTFYDKPKVIMVIAKDAYGIEKTLQF